MNVIHAARPCREDSAQEGERPCLPSQPAAPTGPDENQQQAPVVPPAAPEPLPGKADTPTTAPEPARGLPIDDQLASLPLWAIAAVVVLLLTVLILGFALARVLRHRMSARGISPLAGGADRRSESRKDSREYEALLQAFIGTYDLAVSEVVRSHVQKSLRQVGITPITPLPGDPFDTNFHNGVAGTTAPSPGLAHRIVRVLRPGWRSDDGVLRLADVEVYKD